MKRILCLATALVMLVTLTACADDTTPTTTTAAAPTTTTIDGATNDTTIADATATTTVGDTTTTVKNPAVTTTGSTAATTTVAKTTTTAAKVTTTTKKPATVKFQTPDEFIASMPANLKGTTVTMFLWEDLHNMTYGDPIREFEAKTGITLKTVIANKPEYESQLAGLITAGNSPDIVKCIYNNIGSMKNIQPIEKATGYQFTADPAWDKNIMKNFTYNGKVYAVGVQDTPHHNLTMMYYSKLAVKRAKLEDPYEMYKKDPSSWTWDKFWELCDTFLEKTGRKNGYFGANIGGEDYCRCFGAAFSYYDPDQGKMVSGMKKPETVKRYEIIRDAIEKKWATSTSDGTSFSQGKILFNMSYSSLLEKDHPYYNDNLGFLPLPVDSTTNPVFEFCAYGVPVGAKNAAAVPYFLRYAFSPETNDLDNFYLNDDARKVIETAIKRSNFFYSNGWNYQVWTAILNGTSAQVKSVLDSYADEYQASCDDGNKMLNELPQ